MNWKDLLKKNKKKIIVLVILMIILIFIYPNISLGDVYGGAACAELNIGGGGGACGDYFNCDCFGVTLEGNSPGGWSYLCYGLLFNCDEWMRR